ncbi:MAG: hypothetical protein GF364_03260 [Candidatus Lokiarchaeota archaeon]|nr:hypothetical protein [Candidatus Lokiarchaeota archaeon]
MPNVYLLGVTFAIAGGIINHTGQLLQKIEINKLTKEEQDKDFLRNLIRNPRWLLGLAFVVVFGGILLLLANHFIGGAIIAGLAASGMLVLVWGGVKFLNEKLKPSEYAGIAMIIIGIALLGLSEISIDFEVGDFSDSAFAIRMTLFTIILFVLWVAFRILGDKVERGKSLCFAFAAALPFCLNNTWLQPFTKSIKSITNGVIDPAVIITFIIGCTILILANSVGIAHLQYAFQHGDVSKVVPLQKIPMQLSPIILYYIIYQNEAPSDLSTIFMIFGMILILISGFLLSKKQAAIEKISIEET